MIRYFKDDNTFLYGKFEYEKAIEVASLCGYFRLDSDEDELVTNTNKPSCYNCLYRKWSKESFTCLKDK